MRRFGATVALLAVSSGLSGPLAAATLSELRALQTALDSAESDFRQRSPTLSSAETADYAAYLGRLRDRLADGCAAYALGNASPPPAIRCPQSAPVRMAPAAIDQSSESTRAEATATLDAELNAGLGEFDERLLTEQQRVKAAAPRGGRQDGGGDGAGTGADSAVTEGDGEGQFAGEVAETGGTRAPTDAQTTRGSDAAGPPDKETVAARTPADIPDGSDDDVVARQIREAAEREPDPELRARLWEEYRNYKRGTR